MAVGPVVAFGVVIGGAGGVAGDGGAVSALLANNTRISTSGGAFSGSSTAQPVDAHGLVVQSIGGGGGVGGGASAYTIVVGLPLPEEAVNANFSGTYSLGGSGGAAGNGSSVYVELDSGTAITTGGTGAVGLLAQSVGGGGGGTGGDSSLFMATIGSTNKYVKVGGGTTTFTLNMAVGGTAGSGGSGDEVWVNVGSTGSATIATSGDYATGILAQSIGGGGGNAGVGSANSYSTGNTTTYGLNMTVGGDGGSGGTGGAATVVLFPGATITTAGSSAPGVVVQSIGGGGGVASGGSIGVGALSKGLNSNFSLGMRAEIGLGQTGGSGGTAGSATVTHQGSITTIGNDSPGIVVQSIGGGGGIGGTAGNDSSATDPTDTTNGTAALVRGTSAALVSGPTLTARFDLTMNLGGKGGTGGTGGDVTVTQQGRITTSGDLSPGILAQSIGGGGGKGGVAVAGSETNTLKSIAATLYINSNISLGISGSGGSGNSAGKVDVTLNPGTVVTGLAGQGSAGAGFLSHGVIAQSVGGGGGLGADGTTTPGGAYYLGAGISGGGGNAANGGAVTVNQLVSGVSSITTYGDSAVGLFAQSIGGGGGIAGSGSSIASNVGVFAGNITVALGGRSSGTSGAGGTVLVDFPGTTIQTAGYSSFGILAQSVGGGGGYASISGGATVNLTNLGGTAATGNGGPVTVNLSSTGGITTTGIGAHGILAQSVGGGGGILIQAPVAGVTPSIQFTAPSGVSSTGSGVGGAVSVTSHAPISVSGAGAFAILAQSVASGGGLAVLPSGAVFAGSTQASPRGFAAGTVDVVTQGSITASGENGVAIFAQSAADDVSNASSAVTVLVQSGLSGGKVTGGSGAQGAGIWVVGGSSANLITVDTATSLSAASGQAINYYGNWGVNVTNNGTISGSSSLGDGTLTNAGTQVVAGPSTAGTAFFGRTTIDGNFVQTATGRIVVPADFAGGRSGRLVITRNAVLDGGIKVVPTSLLPNVSLPVVQVDGSLTGGLAGLSDSLFGYQVTRTGNVFRIQASQANFTPAGFNLPSTETQVAGHLQSIWDRGGDPALAPLFALLAAGADRGPATYASQLRQISAGTTVAPGARGAGAAQAVAHNSLSCPQFEGTTAMLVEGECGWLRVTGRVTSQDSGNGVGRYGFNTVTWQIGGQREVAPGWFLGGSLAYETSSLSSGDRSATGRGQGGYGALTVKHQTGPWLLSGAVVGGAGQFNASRTITLPGFGAVAKGSPDTANLAAIARITYTLGQETFYLRPQLTLGAVYSRAGAYQESGAGALNLSVNAASRTAFVATPMLEVGGRVALSNGMLLRPYLGVGAVFQSNTSWKQTARLVSAPAGASGFTTSIPVDPIAARVMAGVQLYTGSAVDVRLQYDGEYSGTTASSAGSLVATLRF